VLICAKQSRERGIFLGDENVGGGRSTQKRFLSVVIPLYNKEKSIRKTLESVLAQTHDAFEVVVIDDGSVDSSVSIVAAIADPRVRLIRQTNGGVSAARNAGVRNARFDHIAFLDADDLWAPDFLETIARLIDAFPHAGIYATSYRRDEGKQELVTLKLEPGVAAMTPGRMENYFRAATFGEQPISASSTCVARRAFMGVGGFKVTVKYGEDLDMWARLALRHEVVYTPEPKAVYRLSAENRAMNRLMPLVPWVFREDAGKAQASGELPSDIARSLAEHVAWVDLYTVTSNLTNPNAKAVLSFLRGIKTETFSGRKFLLAAFLRLPLWLRKAIVKTRSANIGLT
jgi:glycosyltransferase involved in cell wall biosynthesis